MRLLACFGLLVALSIPVHAEDAIRVFVVSRGAASPALERGLQFGADEAKRTATLFGRRFVVESRRDTDGLPAGAPSFAIVNGSPDVAASLARGGAAVLFIARRGDLRTPPGAYTLRRGTGGTRAWHRDLSRYGAGELNERFTRVTGIAMDEDAWLGWVAMKIVVESALRNRPLASLHVDGHQGIPLRFDARRVLEQPFHRTALMKGKEVLVRE